MVKLNKTDFVIRLKRGVRANLELIANYFFQGEPIYTTDSKQLFIADDDLIPQPVASLDMAVIDESGNIVTHGGEIIWFY